MTIPKDLKETPSQTAGPYVHIGLAPGSAGFDIYKTEFGRDIAGPNAAGERIRIKGIVTDGDGAPVKDVMLETWQANAHGIYAAPDISMVEDGFCGWGRVIADFETGEWSFDTIKPGPTLSHDNRQQAPHISIWLVARGINLGLHTRLYFEDEDSANGTDPVLTFLASSGRHTTLVAERCDVGDMPTYRWIIRLQGERETVFFDV